MTILDYRKYPWFSSLIAALQSQPFANNLRNPASADDTSIIDIFTWSNTPQGYNFWNCIDADLPLLSVSQLRKLHKEAQSISFEEYPEYLV